MLIFDDHVDTCWERGRCEECEESIEAVRSVDSVSLYTIVPEADFGYSPRHRHWSASAADAVRHYVKQD
jgi:hypothetical protein